MGDMDGKVAVITGAGAGMAKACAELFVEHGAKVVAADISGKEKDTAAELGEAVVPVHCDVSQEDQVVAMFETAVREFGRVDAVLNVAGIADGAPLADSTLEMYDRIMAVDLRGVFLGTKHAIRAMRPTGGGAIVNWASLAALASSGAHAGVYSAAKAGVIALTRVAATEYAADGIRANSLCPGIILTDMGQNAVQAAPEKLQKPAMQRGGTPREVAELALFLASERSSYLTGLAVPIDGGWGSLLR
ncbi:SDR family oxidoreductase [Streptomyces sp. KM273126]|uniref:SDR family NAD(P)-dependent oxidoreductase n=1 Tax=Streptomyces sp. KM273126 TaxID=2545247 RepID=UPI00103F4DC9|nr:SDR family oxidoreductase [Streptomyces sp. KM273126]MBA2810197.1 SDR family oxidoreductase [Streptomyces sp. KM273126]